MSATKTWLTNPYDGSTFIDPNSGLRYTIANNPANPGDVAPAPASPDCQHANKEEWLGIETHSGATVYICRDCGRLVTALGVKVSAAHEVAK